MTSAPDPVHWTERAIVGASLRAGRALCEPGILTGSMRIAIQAIGEGMPIPEVARRLNGTVHPTVLADLVTDAPPSHTIPGLVQWLINERRSSSAATTAGAVAESLREGNTEEARRHFERLREQLDERDESAPPTALDFARLLTEEPEPIPWLIPGWLARGDTVIVAGEPGTGKSVLTTCLAVDLARGAPIFGHVPVRSPCGAMVLDEENPAALVRHRLRQIISGSEHDPATLPLRYLHSNEWNLDRPDDYAALRHELDTNPAQLLVLDSLIRLHNREENDNVAMAKFFRERIRPLTLEYGCAVIVLHHLAKPSKERSDVAHRIRGASDLRAVADHVWALEGDRGTPTRKLSQDKNRWASELQPALSLCWNVSDDGKSATLTAEAESMQTESILRRALDSAGHGGRLRSSLVQACEAAGLTEKSTQKYLGKLHGQGTIRRLREGREVRYWNAVDAPPESE